MGPEESLRNEGWGNTRGWKSHGGLEGARGSPSLVCTELRDCSAVAG